MKHTRREFLLSSTAIGALLSGNAEARSVGHGNPRAGGAGVPPQIIASLTVAGSSTTVNYAASVPNAVVGPMVVTMSPPSPPFSGTITLDGGGYNSEGYHTSGSTSGSNLLAPGGGSAPGTYTDVRVRASQSGLADLVIQPSLVASTGTNPTNIVGFLFDQQPYNSVMGISLPINISPVLNSTSTGSPGVFLVNGTVSLTFGGVGAGLMTIQWMLDVNTPIGPQITGPPGTYSWDTTTVPDGTHGLWLKVLDLDPAGGLAVSAGCVPKSITVLNHDPALISPSVAQTVASVPSGAGSTFGVFPAMPDLIPYPGSPSLVASTAHPTNWLGQAVPPATSDSRYMGANAALLRGAGSYWYAEPCTSYRWRQYQYELKFGTLRNNGTNAVNQGVCVLKFDPQIGGLSIDGAYELMIRANPWDGGRLDNLITPWSEFQEVPPGATFATPGSGFLGIEIVGRLVVQPWTGAAVTVFGFKADRTALSVDFGDLNWAEGDINRTHVGTCLDFGDLGGAGDLCFDPDVPDICYVAVTTHNFIAVVNLSSSVTTGGLPPLSARIYAGADVADAYIDNATAANARFAQPSGMDIIPTSGGVYPKGTMLIADYNNNAIRAIARTSPAVPGAVTTIMGGSLVTQPANFAAYIAGFSTYCPTSTTFTGSYVQGPNKLEVTSDNGFVFVETWNNAVRYANLTGNLVTVCGTFGGDPLATSGSAPGGFRWVTVDRTGCCGPVDDWITLQVSGAAGRDTWRGNKDGSYQGLWVASPDGTILRQGNPVIIAQGIGHYSWGITFARTQGRMIGNGIGTTVNMVLRIAFQAGVNGSTVTDPIAGSVIENYGGGGGFESWMAGTTARQIDTDSGGTTPLIFPYNSRPSFWNLLGSGSCNLGAYTYGGNPYNSYDDLYALPEGNYNLHPGDPANAGTLSAYIQAGLGGAVPRPEFTGNSLRDLIYWLKFGSILGAWPLPQYALGPTNPDVTAPVISNVSFSHIGNSITAHWDTDKPTFGYLAISTPNQYTVTGGSQRRLYFMGNFEDFTPGVASYKTTGHSATFTGLPAGVTPLHCSITAKDIAFNSAYIVDQVVA